MAIPTTPLLKAVSLASDGVRRTLYPDGAPPVPTPPVFTTTKTTNSITAVISQSNHATSYEIRVDEGTAVSGLTVSGLSAGTTYAVQVRGINESGTSDWSTAVNVETVAASGGDPVPTLFSDDFSGRDLSSPQINNCGFSWGNMMRTSLVIVDPDDGERVVFNGSSVYNPNGDPNRDWTPFQPDGVSLRFRFPAESSLSGEENRAEQRWSMSTAVDDLWFKLRWRVPINFVHNNVGGSASNNNKFFMFWMDAYSSAGDGSTVGSEYRESSGDSSYFYAKVSQGNQNLLGGDQGNATFITSPADQGEWRQVIGHIVAESSPGADDGTVDYWIEEWNGSAWVNRVLSISLTGQPIKKPDSGGPNGFAAGFLFGTANSSFLQETEFLVDLFQLSEESLL